MPARRVRRFALAQPIPAGQAEGGVADSVRHCRSRPRMAVERPVPGHQEDLDFVVCAGGRRLQRDPVGGVLPDVPEFKLNKLSRDGPEWNTGIYVDAIIMIVNSLTKEEYYLIARKQYINRSD